jgi:uncharacterized protein with HEPN domain
MVASANPRARLEHNLFHTTGVAIGNILRHEYQRVDPTAMWRIATVELPKLEVAVRRVLSDLGSR